MLARARRFLKRGGPSQTVLDSHLYQSILDFDVRGVQKWLARGANPNLDPLSVKLKKTEHLAREMHSTLATTFSLTVLLGERTTPEQREIASMLVEAGVDVDQAINLGRRSALIVGAGRCDLKLCRWAVSRGANIHHVATNKETALSVIMRRAEYFERLTGVSFNPNDSTTMNAEKNGEGLSPTEASKIIDFLVESGARPSDVEDFASYSPAVRAVVTHALDRVQASSDESALIHLGPGVSAVSSTNEEMGL